MFWHYFCFLFLFVFACLSAMSKAAVKISADLLSNPLCEQDQEFLASMTSLDTAMRRMDAFNQEKVSLIPTFNISSMFYQPFLCLLCTCNRLVPGEMFFSDTQNRKLDKVLLKMHVFTFVNILLPVDWKLSICLSFCCFWKASVVSSSISSSYWLSAVKIDAFVTHWCLE